MEMPTAFCLMVSQQHHILTGRRNSLK